MGKKLGIIGLLICILATIFGCGGKELDFNSQVEAGSGLLEVHIIDVGQADSILIRTPKQGDILIDGGTNSAEDTIIAYLQKQGVDSLEAVIATHPHEDHIGGLDGVLNTFETKTVYMPKVSHTTATFERFLKAIEKSKAQVVQVKGDVALKLPEGGAQGIFLAPNSDEYDELNDYSAVLKLVYGQTSFMLTGDAEKLSEGEIMARYASNALKADVLKVGHHGSKTSTSEEFLAAVNPQLALISVGKDNDYGLPHPNTIALLEREKIPYLRTDEVGTIVVYSDGKNIALDADELESGNEVKPVSQETAEPPTVLETPSDDAAQPTAGDVVLESVDRAAEIVILKNNNAKDVDLSGWVLVSVKGDQRYTIPDGTMLTAGGTLRILSGKDAVETAGSLVWSNQNIWNNDNDPAELYNAAGKLVDQLE